MLHTEHLPRVPSQRHHIDDAAVPVNIAIKISGAFPNTNSGQVRRLQRGHLPLIHRVIRNAVEANLAVAPGLPACPLNAIVKILCLARRPHLHAAGRASGAARVHAYAHVAIRHPFLRIDDLPVLILVAGAGGHIGVCRDHAIPHALEAFLERKPLGIGAMRHDHRVFSFCHRTKDVGPQQ